MERGDELASDGEVDSSLPSLESVPWRSDSEGKVWENEDLKSCTLSMDEKELVEELHERLQRKLSQEAFNRMTEDLPEKRIPKEKLADLYDKLNVKLNETVKQRLSISLQRGSTVHPLLINHVLDTVFKNFIPGHRIDYGFIDTDFANFRLVCKIWNKRAIAALRETKMKITFGTDLLDPESADTGLQRYLDVMENSTFVPFSRYSFRQGILFPPNYQLLGTFLKTVATDATSLEFDFGPRRSTFSLNLANGNDSALLNLANLKILKVDYTTYQPDTQSSVKGIPQFIMMLLASTMKLKQFSLRLRRHSWPEVLRRIPHTTNCLFLEVLKLDSSHFLSLIEANIKLEELSLHCWEYIADNDARNTFFQKQKDTLTTINMTGIAFRIFTEGFPILMKLRELIIQGAYIPPPQLSIGEAFPKLRVLNLKALTFALKEEYVDVFLSDQPPVTSVEKLYLPVEAEQWRLMKFAAKMFPNVKSLYVHLGYHNDVYTVDSVCTFFTKIEELHVTFSESEYNFYGDAMVTGVSKKVCKMLLRNDNFIWVPLEDFQERNSMLNLTKLKSLSMCEDVDIRTATLTDLSAHHIFLKMESLEELRISGSMISPYYKKKLKDKLKVFHAKDQEGQLDYYNEYESDASENSIVAEDSD